LSFPEVESKKKGEETLLSSICPTVFTIHETFPILLLQDGTHFCSFALNKELYERIKNK